MSAIVSIAASGLSAATRRLEVAASNIANADSAGPLPSADPAIRAQYPAAYPPERLDTVETAGGGTRAVVSAVSPGYTAVSDPTAPYADSNGMVAVPNVDFANEAVEMMQARVAFAANVQVLRTYSRMMKSLFDIKT